MPTRLVDPFKASCRRWNAYAKIKIVAFDTEIKSKNPFPESLPRDSPVYVDLDFLALHMNYPT